MGDGTEIQWCDATWSPVRGCTRISRGCGDATGGGCYAERIAARFSGDGKPFHGFAEMRAGKARWTGRVELVPEQLDIPLRWRKPRRIFVCSMSDLFHESLSNEAIAAVFGVMAACPQHTFLCLTKRAARMREWFEWLRKLAFQNCRLNSWPEEDVDFAMLVLLRVAAMKAVTPARPIDMGNSSPLPNVHLGVSVEDRKTLWRVDELRACPAALRFLSLEPILEDLGELNLDGIGHVITGGESGPGARPCDVAWIRSVLAQCRAAGVPAFCKQVDLEGEIMGEGGT